MPPASASSSLSRPTPLPPKPKTPSSNPSKSHHPRPSSSWSPINSKPFYRLSGRAAPPSISRLLSQNQPPHSAKPPPSSPRLPRNRYSAGSSQPSNSSIAKPTSCPPPPLCTAVLSPLSATGPIPPAPPSNSLHSSYF